jgi:hypothetical protein
LQSDNPEKNIEVADIKNRIRKGSLALNQFYCSRELIQKIIHLEWLTSLELSWINIEDSADLKDLENLKDLTKLTCYGARLKKDPKYKKKYA